MIKRVITDPSSNWYRLIKSVYTDIDDGVRARLFENFVINGCIAGGRRYLHINAGGDIEPCAFIHYSDSNIREKTLLEAYQSPLFMAYHDNQPFNDNMLRPCPLLDNQGKLAEMVDQSGAHFTDLQNPEDVHDLCAK